MALILLVSRSVRHAEAGPEDRNGTRQALLRCCTTPLETSPSAAVGTVDFQSTASSRCASSSTGSRRSRRPTNRGGWRRSSESGDARQSGRGGADTNMRIDLSGARALVTGASRRIGRAIALSLARAGADIAVQYVSDEAAARGAAAAIEAAGRQPGFLHYRRNPPREWRLVTDSQVGWGAV